MCVVIIAHDTKQHPAVRRALEGQAHLVVTSYREARLAIARTKTDADILILDLPVNASAVPQAPLTRSKAWVGSVLNPRSLSTEIASSDGRIRLNPPTRECWLDGIPLFWTGREFDLLRFFVENPGRVLTFQTIFLGVWGSDRRPNKYMVHTYVSKLRARLSAHGLSLPLHTIRSTGYVLNCRARRTTFNQPCSQTNQNQT